MRSERSFYLPVPVGRTRHTRLAAAPLSLCFFFYPPSHPPLLALLGRRPDRGRRPRRLRPELCRLLMAERTEPSVGRGRALQPCMEPHVSIGTALMLELIFF